MPDPSTIYPDESVIETFDKAIDEAEESADQTGEPVYIYKVTRDGKTGYVLTDDYTSGGQIEGKPATLITIVKPEYDED